MGSRIDEKYRSYILLWDKIGIKILTALKALFAIMLFIQFLMLLRIDGLPPISALRMEGKAIIENIFDYTEGEIVLKTDKISKGNTLKVLINGTEKYSFDKEVIAFTVKEADIIEICGVDSSDKANITVHNVSENISIPKVGLSYQVNNNLVFLFRIKMKTN